MIRPRAPDYNALPFDVAAVSHIMCERVAARLHDERFRDFGTYWFYSSRASACMHRCLVLMGRIDLEARKREDDEACAAWYANGIPGHTYYGD